MSIHEKSGLELRRIGGLLRAARDAIGVSRGAAGEWIGAHERTIQNWEDATSPTALRLAIYLRELARKSDLAREFVLQILGLGEGVPEGDPELRAWQDRLARAWTDPQHRRAVRKTLEGVFELVDESSGERHAASA